MDIEKLIEKANHLGMELKRDGGEFEYSIGKKFLEYATALSTLQAENERLRAELEQVKRERDAAVEAVKNMAEYIVCAGRVDYYLCDEISQEHHLKYQPKNDGNYDNEPCYKCIADWFLQGHKWQENC